MIGNWTLKAEYLYVGLGSLDDMDLPPSVTINSVNYQFLRQVGIAFRQRNPWHVRGFFFRT